MNKIPTAVFANFLILLVTVNGDDECIEAFRRKVKPFIGERVASPPSRQITVSVQMILKSLFQVSETLETVRVLAFLSFSWTDSRLAVTVPKCANRTFNVQPVNTIWYPQFIVDNADQVLPVDTWEKFSLTVDFDGRVSWLAALNVALKCEMDVHLYPLDFQECYLSLRSPTYHFDELRYQIKNRRRAMLTWSRDMSCMAWRLRGQGLTMYSQTPGVMFNFIIVRSPKHYIISVILPTMVINVLQLASFVLPKSSDEKMTAAFSCLLSYFLIYLAFDATLPVKAEKVPVIMTFYAFITSLSLVMTLYIALIVRIDHWVQRQKAKARPHKQHRRTSTLRNIERILSLSTVSSRESQPNVNDANFDRNGDVTDNVLTAAVQRENNKKLTKKLGCYKLLPDRMNNIGLIFYGIGLVVSYILFGGYLLKQASQRKPVHLYSRPQQFNGTFF